jgi:cytochrome P450
VEQQVIDEIDEFIGSEEPSYENIQKLKFLPMVMKESLRLFPSVSMQTTRITNQDTVIEKDGQTYHLPKGTYVEVWPWLLHRAEDLWDDPLTFKPERFASGESYSYRYTPFGDGPRNCIGQNLATMESKVILAMIYQHYR